VFEAASLLSEESHPQVMECDTSGTLISSMVKLSTGFLFE
jgi:hypothetical protein